MKKLIVLAGMLLLCSFTFAWKNAYFQITSSGAYQPGNLIKVSVSKNLPTNIHAIQLFIGDTKLTKLANSRYPDYFFKINSSLNINDRYVKLHVDYLNKKSEDFVYRDIKFPYFSELNTIDATGGSKIKINLSTSLNDCYLLVGSSKWAILGTGDKKYLNIPKRLDNDIHGGYVVCDGLASNYVKFFIPRSPDIIYAISKDKTPIYPGSTLIVKGKYIRLSPEDDIHVFLGNIELSAKFLNDNTFEITLPNKNINASLKVVRNGFESNSLQIKATYAPVIYNVTTNNNSNGVYFEIYGNFKFDLGKPIVTYNNQVLPILSYKSISQNIQLIKARFPLPEWKNDDFTCPINLKPGSIVVTIGNIKSNAFYYVPFSDYQVTKIDYPKCNNGSCTYKLYLNKNLPNKIHLYLNGGKVDAISSYNVITFSLDKLVKRGNLQIEFPNCTLSQVYSFDFSNYFKPIITNISSRQNFIPSGEFRIEGEKITNDGFHNDMGIKLNLSPDVLLNDKFLVKYATVEGSISALANKGQLVKVSLSNVNGESNGGYFVIGGKNNYLGDPVIENVLYPDGGFAGNELIIKGYNFSDICTNDKVYLGNKVFYPDKCKFNEIDIKIPQGNTFDTIKIGRKDDNIEVMSSLYKLSTTLGGIQMFNKFRIIGLNEGKYVDLNKNNKVDLDFKIYNPITDIFLPELKFKVLTNKQVLPISNIQLTINGNLYQYSFIGNKIYPTNLKLLGFVKKQPKYDEVIFKNVFIPFSAKPIDAHLSFTIDNSIFNNQNVEIYSSAGGFYYNIFSPEVAKHLETHPTRLAKVIIQNLVNQCFDSDPTNSNCALALKGGDLQEKLHVQNNAYTSLTKTTKKTHTSLDKGKSQTLIHTKTTVKSPSGLLRAEKIARKLNKQKMNLLNNVIKSFIISQKRKYRGDDKKIKYIIEMYRGYKQMIQNTSDDFQKKIKYVKGLIYFARNYFAFMKQVK